MPPANALLEAALAYAARGWPLVPVHTPRANGRCSCRHGAHCPSPGKHPRYHPHDLPHGLYDATVDRSLIASWWTRWPQANIGIATGRESGLLVVDLDGKNHYPFPPTTVARTGKGQHIYLLHPPHALRNHVRLLPDLDIRGQGALAVAPPSRHANGERYRWQHWADLAPVPPWLLAHLQPPTSAPVAAPGRGTAYAQAVLRREAARLAAAPVGTRNTSLNWAAYRCGQFVTRGDLDQQNVEQTLTTSALACGLQVREIASTLRSGLQAARRAAPTR